jgi:hypothetical protein
MSTETEQIIEWTPALFLEVSLAEPDDFLKVKETLTRIGISAKKEEKTLYQSCHILHKHGRYYIVSFKELFVLDGKPSTLTQNDIDRRNSIAQLLSDWGLLSIVNPAGCEKKASMRQIKVLSHKEKKDWILKSKYTLGRFKASHTT